MSRNKLVYIFFLNLYVLPGNRAAQFAHFNFEGLFIVYKFLFHLFSVKHPIYIYKEYQ